MITNDKLFFMLLIFLFSCNQKNENIQLIGLWTGKIVDESLTQEQTQVLDNLMKGSIEFEFKENNSVNMFAFGYKEKGQYTISPDYKQIEITVDEKNQQVQIKGDKLVMEIDGKNFLFTKSDGKQRAIGALENKKVNDFIEKQSNSINATWELISIDSGKDMKVVEEIEKGTQITFNSDSTFTKKLITNKIIGGKYTIEDDQLILISNQGRKQEFIISKLEMGELMLREKVSYFAWNYKIVYE